MLIMLGEYREEEKVYLGYEGFMLKEVFGFGFMGMVGFGFGEERKVL